MATDAGAAGSTFDLGVSKKSKRQAEEEEVIGMSSLNLGGSKSKE